MQEQYLILINQTENSYFPNVIADCDLKSLYSSYRYWNRILRKIALRYDIFFLENILFNSWMTSIEKAKGVILFDTGNAPYLIKLINKRFPEKRVILWYWNSIAESVSIESYKDCKAEFWSFDKNDCKKYQMKYNTQIFIEENLRVIEHVNDGKEVFYVGADKNRAELLFPLKEYFERNGISYLFNLVKYGDSENNYGLEYMKPLIYSEVLSYADASKAIVDLVADWQSGLTLRPLEALYLKKKLITNMKNIVEYDFYNPKNIFILGVDDISGLRDFIKGDYDDTNYNFFRRRYSFQEWLKRFDD